MTETRTQNFTIDLSDNPDEDIRVARMEMNILPWKWALRDEGWKVSDIKMEPVHTEWVIYDMTEGPRKVAVTFEVIMFITRDPNYNEKKYPIIPDFPDKEQ